MRIEKWDNLQPGIYTTVSAFGTAVVLEQIRGSWHLLVAGIEPVDLGKRASFDDAELALLELTDPAE